MNFNLGMGVVILLGISILARIIPVFISDKFSNNILKEVKEKLPLCVFITMCTYFFITETDKYPVPAVLAFTCIVIFILMKVNNFISIFISIMIYVLFKNM